MLLREVSRLLSRVVLVCGFLRRIPAQFLLHLLSLLPPPESRTGTRRYETYLLDGVMGDVLGRLDGT